MDADAVSGLRILRTPRLRLVPAMPQDLPFLIELDSDPEVLRYILGRARTEQEAREYWAPQLPGPMWIGHVGDEHVGWWCLWPREGGVAELGYRLARRWWRQRLAAEGARAVLEAGFADPGLQVVRAETMAVNAGSRGVMRRLGMREVRVEVREWADPLPGAEVGEVLSELSRQDWSSTAE